MKVVFTNRIKSVDLKTLKKGDIFLFATESTYDENVYNMVISIKAKEQKDKISYIPLKANGQNVLVFYADGERYVKRVEAEIYAEQNINSTKLSALKIGDCFCFSEDKKTVYIKTDKASPDFGAGTYKMGEFKDKAIDFDFGTQVEMKDLTRDVYPVELTFQI